MQNFEDKIKSYIKSHINLVADYESMPNAIPLDCCMDELCFIFKNIFSDNKLADFTNVFSDALRCAIKYDIPIVDCFEIISIEGAESTQNSIQQYFKEINSIYSKNKNDFNIEYCEENKNKLIEMNLKMVISIAKKYQGLGLSLGELISAGNLGLMVSWDKFNPNRSKLKDDMINAISELADEIDYDDLEKCVDKFLTYGDIRKKFDAHFTSGNKYHKNEIRSWINSNVYNAKFSSIAAMWIRAYILIEIDNCSRLVKKPKTEIYKDKLDDGTYKREIVCGIDSPITEDSDAPVSDVLMAEEERQTDLEASESYAIFKENLYKLLDGVKTRDRGILLKKFGIGLPRPMLPKEIAEQEGLSIARVSQILQSVIEQIQENQRKYDINVDKLFAITHNML